MIQFQNNCIVNCQRLCFFKTSSFGFLQFISFFKHLEKLKTSFLRVLEAKIEPTVRDSTKSVQIKIIMTLVHYYRNFSVQTKLNREIAIRAFAIFLKSCEFSGERLFGNNLTNSNYIGVIEEQVFQMRHEWRTKINLWTQIPYILITKTVTSCQFYIVQYVPLFRSWLLSRFPI